MALRSWLQTALFGVRQVLNDGAILPERGVLNFIGATITDDPALKQTNVEFPASAIVGAATKNATPNTLALRGASAECNFAGTCNFETLAASVSITSVDITASASCSADTLEAATSVTSPSFLSAAGGEWRSAPKTAPGSASGAVVYGSGLVTGLNSNSGTAVLASGDATQASGDLTIGTGVGTSISSGTFRIQTGTSNGISGDVLIHVGVGATTSGNIALLDGDNYDFGGGERVIWIAEAIGTPGSAPASGGILAVESAGGELWYYDRDGGGTKLSHYVIQADVGALTDSSGGTAGSTIVALPDPADAPATADALRDDLVANLIPALRNDIASLTAQLNALRTAALAHGWMA